MDGGGETVLCKLKDEYLERPSDWGTLQRSADRDRKNSAGELVRYACGGAEGTCLSITCSENARWMHGWQLAGAGAGCQSHQDWMSWKTIVLAFAISKGDARLMVQMTLCVPYAQAQQAAGVLPADSSARQAARAAALALKGGGRRPRMHWQHKHMYPIE